VGQEEDDKAQGGTEKKFTRGIQKWVTEREGEAASKTREGEGVGKNCPRCFERKEQVG